MKKQNVSLGIDIGGTKISAGCLINEELISNIETRKTPDTASKILNSILNLIKKFSEIYSINNIGIATAGAVNKENTKIIGSTGNLPKGYANLDFKKEIEKIFNIKTLIENDANAAAFAEYKLGNAQKCPIAIILTLGTGIGGGILINSELYKGKTGAGGECGHIPINWNKKRKCTCGGWDCWESYASGTGHLNNAKEMAKILNEEEKKLFLNNKEIKDLTNEFLIEGLNKNNKFCINVYNQWEDLLLTGLINYTNIFDPDCIVLSGGMAEFVNFKQINNRLKKESFITETKVLPAKLKNNAGLIGAGILANEKFRNASVNN